MNLARITLLCMAMISLAGLQVVRAEDQPASQSGEAAQEQPAVHCEGQNCLPPKDNPVQECKGQDCTPAPATDKPPAPVIEQVK